MSSNCAIDFTTKKSNSLVNEFQREKVEKIKIFKTLEILCVHINIKSNLIKKLFSDIHFSPITSFSFYFDSNSNLVYLSICNQDICAFIEIDYDGFKSDNFHYLLLKMKDTLLISSENNKIFLSNFSNVDEYFFLTDYTSTFLEGCVSILKTYIIKEYNLSTSYSLMTYSSFLEKNIESILFYFLYRQSISPSLFSIDKSFFESPLSKQFKEYSIKDFLLLEILEYDPSYFIQYAFHKETQTLNIVYVFRVEPIENFWEKTFKYPYLYESCGYIKPSIEYDDRIDEENLLEEEEEENENNDENQLSCGGLIFPFINLVNVKKLNQSLLLNGSMKTKIIYTIFYALDYIYYNSEIRTKSPDIFSS